MAVELGRHSKRFGRPVAMTEAQIRATVDPFATTARLAEHAGFDGVEVHAAHGYLLSQFLSPLVKSGKLPSARTHPVRALLAEQLGQRRALRRYRTWLNARTSDAVRAASPAVPVNTATPLETQS